MCIWGIHIVYAIVRCGVVNMGYILCTLAVVMGGVVRGVMTHSCLVKGGVR